jgi:hypothetical protein
MKQWWTAAVEKAVQAFLDADLDAIPAHHVGMHSSQEIKTLIRYQNLHNHLLLDLYFYFLKRRTPQRKFLFLGVWYLEALKSLLRFPVDSK